jgi:hypothetical protein
LRTRHHTTRTSLKNSSRSIIYNFVLKAPLDTLPEQKWVFIDVESAQY